MKFNIMLLVPQKYRYAHFFDDTVKILYYGLESLGHDVIVTHNTVRKSYMNILIGSDFLSRAEQVEDMSRGREYIVYQNELVLAGQINGTKGTDHFEQIYLPLLQRAKSVWEGLPELMPLWEQRGVRAQFVLWGYHPALEEVVHKRDKDIDFFFFGSMTDRRLKMLTELKERGYVVSSVFDQQAIFRNDLIARSRINLSIRQSGMNHLAWGRHCFLINNRSLVLSERCVDQAWLEDCFLTAETDSWLDDCETAIARSDLQQVTDDCYERYRSTTIMDRLKPILDEL